MDKNKKLRTDKENIPIMFDTDIFMNSSQSFKDIQTELKKLRRKISKF